MEKAMWMQPVGAGAGAAEYSAVISGTFVGSFFSYGLGKVKSGGYG